VRYFYGIVGKGQYWFDTETGEHTKQGVEPMLPFPGLETDDDDDSPDPLDSDHR